MSPELQGRRQARWQRFWRRAPTRAWGQPLSPCILFTGLVMLGKVWGEQWDTPPASLSLHSLLGYATHWTTHPFCTLFLLLNGIPRYPINASPFHHLLPLIISRLHLSSLPQWSSRPLHVDVSVHKHLEKANKQLMAVIDFHYYKASHSL